MIRLTRIFYVIGVILFIGLFSVAVVYAFKMNEVSKKTNSGLIPSYKYHFVLVPEEMDNDYWRLVEKGAQAAAKKHHVLLEYKGPKQSNIDEHLKELKIAGASRVDGILTQGYNDQQFSPVIDNLENKGIPVITVDTDAPSSNRRAYIGSDNYYSGFIAGKTLLADTKGKINVAIITGSFQASHQQLRVQGFKDAIQKEKRVKIIAIEESKITRIRAAEKANKILTEHPETNAFFGTSALDGIGIAQTVVHLNRQNSMYIIAFDTIPDTINDMKKGIIDATVMQEPYEMGFQSVEMMVTIEEGKRVPKINYTETRVIHRSDLPIATIEQQMRSSS